MHLNPNLLLLTTRLHTAFCKGMYVSNSGTQLLSSLLFLKSQAILKISTQPTGFPHSFFSLFILCAHCVCQSPKAPLSFLPVTVIWPRIASPSGLPPTVCHFNFALTTILQSVSFVLLSFLLCQFATGIDFLLFAFLAPIPGLPGNPEEACEIALVNSCSQSSAGPPAYFSHFWPCSCWVSLTFPKATVLRLFHTLPKPLTLSFTFRE